MKLQTLIHRLHNEKSKIGDVTREIEKDQMYYSYKDEARLKDYLNKKLLSKGMLTGFVELLALHELINYTGEMGNIH